MMLETDLRGVDSHGISMLPTYDREYRAGRLNMRPVFKTVREGPAFALIDADASLGHPVSVHAMNLAVDKCRAERRGGGVGVQLAPLRRRRLLLADRRRPRRDRHGDRVHPRRDAWCRRSPPSRCMGTNPLAFAAPARRNAPFQLDMATTTVAAGKVKVYKLNHRALPAGWVVDDEGPDGDRRPSRRSATSSTGRRAASRRSAARARCGGHKGYGLAVMVHILGGALAGASFSPIRNRTQKPSEPHNIGHFFLAIDPRAFRAEGAFEDDLDQVIDVLHGAKRADPDQPVLVAGDPEMATRAERLRDGVPVPDDLLDQLRAVANGASVPFVLTGAPA